MTVPTMPLSALPNNWLAGSTAGTTLTGDPTKRNQLSANTGRMTLVGGPLDDTYIVYNPTDIVVEAAGGGIDTVKTWGSGFVLPANVENLTLMGNANASATGNAGNNLIIGNGGQDRITTGGGNDVLVAGTGADYFVPTKALGTTTWISGLKTAGTVQDKIDLYGYGFQGFDSVKAAMTQVGADVRIDLGGGQTLMLAGKTIADITAATIDVEAAKPSLFLTFDDEFNSLSLNTGTPATAGNVWKTTFFGGDRTLLRNQELEVYVDPDYAGTSTSSLGISPFSDKNGILSISARPASAATLPYLGGYAYTSGLLTTQTSFSQTYGYFEVRAQVPTGQGLWPGFWLLSADGNWPPEIDVLEQIGSGNSYNSNGISSTVAGATVVHGTFLGTDLSQGFHTYGMAWTPQTITFYVDGQQTFQTATPADMNKPMYMLLNLAVGGTWPGSPDGTTNWSTADYKIDYVRAYSYDPTSIAAPVVTLSNAMNPADLSSSFIAPSTGPGTAAVYSAQQMKIGGVVSPTTVSVAYDANDALTVTNKGTWNAVKNATVKTAANGAVTVNNFVDAEITMGNGDSSVTVTGAKRGAITVGNGDDRISVTAQSNDTTQNLMKITAGDGNNHISFTGAMAAVAVTAGNGNNQVTVGGQANGTVKTGAGSDDLVDLSTGALSLTGGGGSDLFEFFAGAHATVTDFQAGQDSIVLHGVSPGQVQVSNSAGSTLIALGGGASIQLAGVALSAGSLNIVYA